jgi:hypothetical protein
VSIIASVSKIPPNLSNCAPVSKTLPILRAMKDKRLDLSIKQQRKFEERKCVLPKYFPEWMRYVPPTHGYGANVLNDDFAYIHIFKNGGTTIAAQTGTRPHGPREARDSKTKVAHFCPRSHRSFPIRLGRMWRKYAPTLPAKSHLSTSLRSSHYRVAPTNQDCTTQKTKYKMGLVKYTHSPRPTFC